MGQRQDGMRERGASFPSVKGPWPRSVFGQHTSRSASRSITFSRQSGTARAETNSARRRTTLTRRSPLGASRKHGKRPELRAARILKGETEETDPEEKIAPLACRFHDLRHTAVSRMLNAGTPIAKVAKIVGWSPATMVRMAARYGHFSLE